jgi:hypothetical protein
MKIWLQQAHLATEINHQIVKEKYQRHIKIIIKFSNLRCEKEKENCKILDSKK